MTEPLARVTVRDKAQITLPAEVRNALHVQSGDDVEFGIDRASGAVTVTGLKTIPADQAWFWTEEWQQGEAEATADYAAGRAESFDSAEAFLRSLTD